MSGVLCMAQENSTFEDTVKNLLKMPHKPHKSAKAEKDGQDEPGRQVAKPSKDD